MATRTVHHAGAVWTLTHRTSIGLGAVEDVSEALPARPMALVEITRSAGHRATQALAVGQLEAMTDEQLVELVQGVLTAREEQE